jgi:beta-glucanase (GH16 family)
MRASRSSYRPALRRRLQAAVLVAAVPLSLGGVAGGGGAAQAAVPGAPSGFSLTFSDDFTGASGTGLPAATWKYDTGAGSTFGTGEIETMTSSTSNVYEDGAGHLVLKALHTGTDPASGWTSGRVETQAATFGAAPGGVVRMESVLQQPNVTTANGAGYWPAFWMLGAGLRSGGVWPSIGEVDAMEDINGRSSVFGTLHCGVNPGGPCNESTGIGSGEHACSGCQTGFHDYAVEIDRSVSPEQVRFSLDGANYFTINANQVDATTWSNAVDHPFFLIYDLAMGGGFPSAFGGGPNAATVSGASMVIDSVAVYNKGPASGGGGTVTGNTITGPGGKCVDVAGDDTGVNNTAVQLWDCQATAVDQHWTYANSTLKTLGRCMDVTSGGTANGTQVQLYDCNGTGSQTWQARADGSLYNPQSGRCLDDPNASTTNGARLQIYDCNGSAAQTWTSASWSTGSTASATSTIQAEAYNAQSGTQTETTSDTGGGQDVGYIANGDWLQYDNVSFGSSALHTLSARVASGAAAGVSGTVEVHLDALTNPSIGSFSIGSTGGWQTWQTTPGAISATTGTHTVFLRFVSGQAADFLNLNWFTFS